MCSADCLWNGRRPGSTCSAGAALVLIALVLGMPTGCSRTSGIERFIPTPETAETALSQVLDAWQRGVPVGPVPQSAPLVHVTDQHRRPAERLAGYRILGEVPGETPRCYAVALTFDPPREERARFVVVGIDPLWVFRFEDYQLLAHWEHKMDDSPAAPASAVP